MELILGIIGIAIVLYVVSLLIQYVIIPIFSVVSIVGIAAGTGIALFMYVRAAIEYLNPYQVPDKVYSRTESDVYEYHGKKPDENVRRRSYFFGPGFYSLWKTWITSWKYIFAVVLQYWNLREEIKYKIDIDWLRYVVLAMFWVGMIAISASVLVVGGFASIGIGLLHAGIMLVVMTGVYLVYTILYGVDHFYLWKHSVTSICPPL